jgi:hypothetical protein
VLRLYREPLVIVVALVIGWLAVPGADRGRLDGTSWRSGRVRPYADSSQRPRRPAESI